MSPISTVLNSLLVPIAMWRVLIQFFLVCVICDDVENFDDPIYPENFEDDIYPQNFETVFEWSHINFTWKSRSQYTKALQRRSYIPENIMPGGIKFYQNWLYISLPKFRNGVPATMTFLPIDTNSRTNSLLTPYPSWEANDDTICDNLQSVLNMEIDSKGIMYIVDGVRMNNINVQCPCKIVLLDLNNHGTSIQTLVLPNNICFQDGGFLNDIVVDETDGDFAYIADASNIDPGIVIYSRYQNRAWKIRDQTMFSQKSVHSFDIAGDLFSQLIPVDGIALSTKSPQRTLYFCSLMAYDVMGITTDILKNESFCRSNIWRDQVKNIGRKQSQTDGMMMDSEGNLYYSLIPLYGVGKWNMFEPFESSEVMYANRETFKWTDGFGMDQRGNLYLITNWAYRYFQTDYILEFSLDIKFRIHRLHTGTRSYLYNDVDKY